MALSVAVYLDQNHWSRLSAVALGRAPDIRGVLQLLRAESEAGRVTCPLSWLHFLETEQLATISRRRELAATMTEISRCATIAPLSALVPEHLARSLARATGLVRVPRDLPAIGRGVAHGFGLTPRSLFDHFPTFLEAVLAADPAGLPEEQRFAAEQTIRDLRRRDREEAEQHMRARTWAAGQQGSALLRTHLARSVMEFLPTINEWFDEHGIQFIPEAPGSQEWLTEVVRNVPELDVQVLLNAERDRVPRRPIRANDLRDVDVLAVAIPSCDVVVTDKFWPPLAARAGLGQRYRTRIFSELTELPSALGEIFEQSGS